MDKDMVLGHRKRLKEKYIRAGINALNDYEIIELLLMYSIPRKDCKPIAKELLSKYKTINEIFDIDINDLINIKGIGENSIILIKLCKDIHTKYLKQIAIERKKLENTTDLIEFLKVDLGSKNIEIFKLIYLHTQNEILDDEIICTGTLDKNYIHIRELVKKILIKNAKSVIFVHNHPSGSVLPSQSDIDFTNRCKGILRDIEINLLDHLIVSKNNFYSFLENKIL